MGLRWSHATQFSSSGTVPPSRERGEEPQRKCALRDSGQPSIVPSFASTFIWIEC